MASAHDDVSARDERLCEILGAYYAASEGSAEPDREQWLKQYPEFASELRSYFTEQDRLRSLAGPLRTTAMGLAEASPPFGDYELLAEIARGGMGVVYKARQVSLNRVVALKLILAGEFAGPAAVQRFRDEAEAVALLDHPNIVPIYEVGFEHGRHFFSMKYFEGGSLADRLDRFVAKPRGAVELMATVARAVHDAHQRGVLHRDLKPSNILLDAQGRPHVVDFGLAKRVGGDGQLTASGAILGSPPYMAPEQTSGQRRAITTATDVYGLGAILYSLLTGRPPFQADSAWETIEQVKERTPEHPSCINRLVDRDLQTICLRCLEKDPLRRYSSAEAVAADLEHWLRGEPIAARPVGRLEHLWRWCLRNPMLASVAAMVGLLLLALIGVLAGSNIMLARKQAEVVRQRDRARKAVDTMYTRVANNWLTQQNRLEPVQREFLEEALKFYQQFAREQGTDPEAQSQAALAYFRVGNLEGRFGRLEKAEAAYRQTIALQEELIRRYPDRPDYQSDLGDTLINFGFVLHTAGRHQEAMNATRRVISVFEPLVRRYPGNHDYRDRLLHNGYSNLAAVLQHLGRDREAETVLVQALSLVETIPATDRNRRDYRKTKGDLLHNLGELQHHAGRHLESLDSFRQEVSLCDKLLAEAPDELRYRSDVAASHHALAGSLRDTGDLREAEREFRLSLDLWRKQVLRYPEEPEHRLGIMKVLTAFGALLQESDRPTEAEALYREALAVGEKFVDGVPGPEYRIATAGVWHNMAVLQFASGDWKGALHSVQWEIEQWEEGLKQAPSEPFLKKGLAGARAGLNEVNDQLRVSAVSMPNGIEAFAR